MKTEKKIYTTPELEIEKFTILCANTVSTGDPNGLEGTGSDYSGGGDWEF